MKARTLFIFLIIGCLAVSCNLSSTKNRSTDDSDNPAFKAYELRMNGQADKAFALLEQTLADDSLNALAWYEYSRTYLHFLPDEKSKEQTLDDILVAVETAIKLDPDNPVFYPFANLALDLNISWNRQAGRSEEWIITKYANYEKMLALDPDQPEVLYGMFEMCLEHGDLLNCNELDINNLADKIKKADPVYGIFVDEDLYDTVEFDCEFVKGLIEKYPDNAIVYGAAGNRCGEDESVDYWAQAVRLDPDMAGATCWLMKYYYYSMQDESENKGMYVEYAEVTADAFLSTGEYPPLQAYIIAALARVYRANGDSIKSEENWKKAEDLDPFIIDYPVHPEIEMFTALHK